MCKFYLLVGTLLLIAQKCGPSPANGNFPYSPPVREVGALMFLESLSHPQCLTRIIACGGFMNGVVLEGYQDLSLAFYNYIINKTQILARIATTDAGDQYVLAQYFPQVITNTTTISTTNVVQAGIYDFPSQDTFDVLVVPNALTEQKWNTLNTPTVGGFVLGNTENLTEENNGDDLYVVKVDFNSSIIDSFCSIDSADACITVMENIGSFVNNDGRVREQATPRLSLYAVASGFAMLKALFGDAIDANAMFGIVNNQDCHEGGYFSFQCVVNGRDIDPLLPEEKGIGDLTLGGIPKPLCLTRLNACLDFDGYQDLVGAFYQYLSTKTPLSEGIGVIPFYALGGTDVTYALRKFFPIVNVKGSLVTPLNFVSKRDSPPFDISLFAVDPSSAAFSQETSDQAWVDFMEQIGTQNDHFILSTNTENLTVNRDDHFYVVRVALSETAPTIKCQNNRADTCITLKSNIGAQLQDDGTVSTGDAVFDNDIFVLLSGFIMLKTLFPKDLDAKSMFAIVEDMQCRENGYFSFGCVVKEPQIEVFPIKTFSHPIGNATVNQSACLTGFIDACRYLYTYQSIAKAFYQYIADFSGTQTPVSFYADFDSTLSSFFPEITLDGSKITINPARFITTGVLDFNALPASLPDVLVLGTAISEEQWKGLSTVSGGGFVLSSDPSHLTFDNKNSTLYVTFVSGNAHLNCTNYSVDACIATRDSNIDDVASGFVMLKVLFSGVLDANAMLNIVTNTDCRNQEEGYFSFNCVVNGDNVEITQTAESPVVVPIGNILLSGSSCLTGLNACTNLGGYQAIARAFYHYVNTFDTSGTLVPVTISTTSSGDPIDDYFLMITTSGGDIDPSAFVTVENTVVSLNANDALASFPDVLVVDSLTNVQWTNVNAGGEGFVLANDVTNLAAHNSDLYVVGVNYGTEETVTACTPEPADACITVRKNIGALLSSDGTVSTGTSSNVNDLYVLGSGFAMLKTLFSEDLDASLMFMIVENPQCRENGYFSFGCVIKGNSIDVIANDREFRSIGNVLLRNPTVIDPYCLTRTLACENLSGYRAVARAFYLYVDAKPNPSTLTHVGITKIGEARIFTNYFPQITITGEKMITPLSHFVVTEYTNDALTGSNSATLPLPAPDILIISQNLGEDVWRRLNSIYNSTFVLLGDDGSSLSAVSSIFYHVVVKRSEDPTIAPVCENVAHARACIAILSNIGSIIDYNNNIIKQGSSTLDLYVLGSGFVMLKVLFPDNLDAEGMFDIVTNAECRDTNGYFSFECLVIDNTRIVPTVPEEESTSGEASSSQNKPLTSAFARLIARSLAARHAPSKDGTYFTQEKTVLEEGSILITQQGTSSTSATSATSGTSVRAIRMRAVYRGEGASVGTLVGAYRYNHTLSALSRDAVDMRVELGMVGDVDVLSGLKLYGHILGVYETGVLTVAFGEHRVDRMMGVGVVGLSYRVSSGANVLADVAIEGRCSVGNAVWVAGSVAYASSFCDTILKLRISF